MDEMKILLLCSEESLSKEIEFNTEEIENVSSVRTMKDPTEVVNYVNTEDVDGLIIVKDGSIVRLDQYISKIPMKIKVYVQNKNLGDLEYGEALKEGASFFSTINELKGMLGYVEPEVKAEQEEEIEVKKKFRPGEILKKKKDHKQVVVKEKKPKKERKPFKALFGQEKKSNKSTSVNQEKVVIREIQTTKEKLVHTKIISNKMRVPTDYKKTVALLGPSKSGKSFMAIIMAVYLEKRKVYTAIIDTDSQDMSYIFSNESNNLESLSTTTNDIFLLSKYLSLYSDIDKSDKSLSGIMQKVRSVKADNQVVILDSKSMDLTQLESVDQYIYILNSDPFTSSHQLKEIIELTQQIDVQKLIVVINRYSKDIFNKNELRKSLQTIPYYEAIEIVQVTYSDQLLKSIKNGSINLGKQEKELSDQLDYLARLVYPQ